MENENLFKISLENARIKLGLTPSVVDIIINNKQSELLILIFRSLSALVGGNDEQMKHWMSTHNLHTGGVPMEQIVTVSGLEKVAQYLHAIGVK